MPETEEDNAMPKVLWGDESPEEEPELIKKKKKPPSRNPFLRRNKPVNTDIGQWFSENKPRTLQDCADLKKALRTKTTATVGRYTVDVRGSTRAAEIKYVCGPAGEVALKSVAARRLFNRRLASIEQIIEVYLKQFGTEEPEFEVSKPLLDLG